MEQLAFELKGFTDATPTGMFTFALCHNNEKASIYSRGRPDNWRQSVDKCGLCLLFSPPLNEVEPYNIRYLEEVMDIPFIPKIIDAQEKCPIWFQQYNNFILVTNHLSVAQYVHRGPAGTGIGLLEKKNGKWERRVWSYGELYKYCFNIEKIATGCRDCENSAEDCFRYAAKSMFEEAEIEEQYLVAYSADLPADPNQYTEICELEPEEIHTFLRKVSKNTEWEYVNPKHTVDHPFAPTYLRIDEIDFSEVDDVREKNSQRSLQSAATRRAVVRCKEECCYQEHCNWCTKPYYGRPHECQTESSAYGSLSVPGPYTQEQFNRAYADYWESLPHIGRKKVEMIAYNGGLTTYIYGRELVLGRMTSDMSEVFFIHPATGEHMLVSYEDAVLLCTTPYRRRGEYEYPWKRTNWETVYWRDSPAMDDELFYTYVEICQHDYLRRESCGGWGGSITPTLRTVEWDRGSIEFETDRYYSHGRYDNVLAFVGNYAPTQFPKSARWIKEQIEKEIKSQE